MSMKIRPATSKDRATIERMLSAEQLPLDGVAEHLAEFLVADDDGTIRGAAGLEVHDTLGLLRSLVVEPAAKGTGLGRALTEAQLAAAREKGLRAVYLLTTTAERFFPRFGFEPVGRDDVPSAVQRSREFQGACPASAIIMRRSL
jgi:amino-acid N-acetyltransferase